MPYKDKEKKKEAWRKWYSANKKRENRKNRVRRNARFATNRLRLIEEWGGACVRCGYSACAWALEFHHIDPKSKSFSIGAEMGRDSSYARLKAEAEKCILVCANCHREIEYTARVVQSG